MSVDPVLTHPAQGKSLTELPFLPPDIVSAMEEERIGKRKERELRRQLREERRKQKELRRQQKIQKAAEMYKVTQCSFLIFLTLHMYCICFYHGCFFLF